MTMRLSLTVGLAVVLGVAVPLSAQLPTLPQPTPRPYGAPTGAADSLNLVIVIVRAAIAHGTHMAHSAPLPRLVCLAYRTWDADPPAGVVGTLQDMDTIRVRPISNCRQQPATRPTPHWTDTLTGQRGIAVWAAEPQFTRGDGSFTVQVGYGEHGLSAGLWKCTGRKRDDKWEVSACTLTAGA